EPETELLDARPSKGNAVLEVAVDEDVALRRRNQIIRKGLGPDVVKVASDAERRKRLGPSRACLCVDAAGDRHGRRERNPLRHVSRAQSGYAPKWAAHKSSPNAGRQSVDSFETSRQGARCLPRARHTAAG